MKTGKIYVTGDTHGDIDIGKFAAGHFREGKLLGRNDYVLVAGDFGCLWSGSKEDMRLLDWVGKRPFTTLFIDGNHENFDLLSAYPVEKWNGGKVHCIHPKVLHLMRGQVFSLSGVKIFTFGGATSTDKAFRREHSSWWKEEMPSEEELIEGGRNLEAHDWKVDYIITHTAPSRLLRSIGQISRKEVERDLLTDYLDRIYEKATFKKWFFGHYHIDHDLGENVGAVYDGFYRLEV